jgi:hypothetical protein
MLRGLFCAVLFLKIAAAQSAAAGPKEEVLKVEAAFNDAKIHNDLAALDRIVAYDYVGINQWGFRRDKGNLLAVFRSAKTASLVPSRVRVVVSGELAIVDGIMNESIDSNQMGYLFMRTYVKREGRWQLVANSQTFAVDQRTGKVVEPPKPFDSPKTMVKLTGRMGR